jgi:hypothetical protein
MAKASVAGVGCGRELLSLRPDTGARLLADMRVAIKAVTSGVEGRESRTEDIDTLEYDAEAAPASGLGLFIAEAHRLLRLLRQLQGVVPRKQAARITRGCTPRANDFT